MRVYKVKPSYGSACCETDIKTVISWFEELQAGDNLLMEIVEMTEEEYEALPEYMGP